MIRAQSQNLNFTWTTDRGDYSSCTVKSSISLGDRPEVEDNASSTSRSPQLHARKPRVEACFVHKVKSSIFTRTQDQVEVAYAEHKTRILNFT
jgi:hypothetical protein